MMPIARAVPSIGSQPSCAHHAVSHPRLQPFTKRVHQQHVARQVRVAVTIAPDAETIKIRETQASLKKLLLQEKGWTKAWVDTILDTVRKGKLITTEAKAAAAVDAIASLSFSDREVENICHKAPDVLACEAADISAVIDYMKATGASEEEVKKTLLKTPRALVYKVSANGNHLEMGNARMELDVTTSKSGERRLVVSVFRVGAAFESAPVSPWKPMHQR